MIQSNEKAIKIDKKVIWKKNIILFLGSQGLSLFGSSLVQYAIMWHITLTTKSGSIMTLYVICGFIPAFILSPVTGVLADRYNRKMLIIASDLLIAVSTLIMAVLFSAGYDPLWLLFVIAAIRAVGTGIQSPAVGAILPQIVPDDKLMKVNGTNGSIQALIMFVSPVASGALITVTSLEAIFFIDVITAAIAVFTLLVFLDIPAHARALLKQTTSYFTDLKEGFAYIREHGFLKKFFIFFIFFFVLVAPAAFLTPLQVARSFGSDVWRLTAIELAFSAGMMLGGALLASWGGFKNKIHTMTFASLLIGACTFALGVVPVFWIYLVFMVIFGVAVPLFNAPSTVLIQEKVEADYLGRMFGVLGMISTSMMPLGMLIFGPIADIVRIEWILIGSGILLFILGFFLISSRLLINAGKPFNDVLSDPDR